MNATYDPSLTLRRHPPAVAFLLLFVALLATLIIVLVALPAIDRGAHATVRHGSEAEAIRACLDQTGPTLTYRDRTGVYFFLCKLPDGRWGTELARKLHGRWAEITAYVKGDGTLTTVTVWLLKQGATRYKGVLP